MALVLPNFAEFACENLLNKTLVRPVGQVRQSAEIGVAMVPSSKVIVSDPLWSSTVVTRSSRSRVGAIEDAEHRQGRGWQLLLPRER